MKFSEKEILRYHETIPHWRIKWLRIDLDPLYADKVYGLLKECYEAAREIAKNLTAAECNDRLGRRGKLHQRSVALDGGKRHLRLEGRCVVPARSSAHGFS